MKINSAILNVFNENNIFLSVEIVVTDFDSVILHLKKNNKKTHIEMPYSSVFCDCCDLVTFNKILFAIEVFNNTEIEEIKNDTE